jgi:hypothetical protein
MTYGVTSTGFERKTFEAIQDALRTEYLGSVSAQLQFTGRSKIGNLVAIHARQLAEAWEAIEAAYHGFDPDNCVTDEQFEALCALTSVTREGASKGSAICTINVDAGFSAAAGALLASVTNRPTELWTNRDAIVSAGGGDLTDIVFETMTEGATPFVAAGELAVVAGTYSGWNSITNPADATQGTAKEPIDALHIRRENSLAREGGSTLAGVVSEVATVENVIAVSGRANSTDMFDGIPAHSYEIVIYEASGSPADDDAVAQAIFDSGQSTNPAVGTENGTADDPLDGTQTVYFSRADTIDLYIEATVTGTYDADDVKEAIATAYTPDFDQTIVLQYLRAQIFTVEGVTDVPAITMSLDDVTYTEDNFVPEFGQIGLLDTGRIVIS